MLMQVKLSMSVWVGTPIELSSPLNVVDSIVKVATYLVAPHGQTAQAAGYDMPLLSSNYLLHPDHSRSDVSELHLFTIKQQPGMIFRSQFPHSVVGFTFLNIAFNVLRRDVVSLCVSSEMEMMKRVCLDDLACRAWAASSRRFHLSQMIVAELVFMAALLTTRFCCAEVEAVVGALRPVVNGMMRQWVVPSLCSLFKHRGIKHGNTAHGHPYPRFCCP